MKAGKIKHIFLVKKLWLKRIFLQKPKYHNCTVLYHPPSRVFFVSHSHTLWTHTGCLFSHHMCACLHIRPTAKGYVLHMCHTPLEEPVLSPVLTSWQCRHLFSTLPHWASHIHSQSPVLQLYAARHAVRTGHRTGHCISVICWQLQYRQRTARKWKSRREM